jgi:gas vesicle protein
MCYHLQITAEFIGGGILGGLVGMMLAARPSVGRDTRSIRRVLCADVETAANSIVSAAAEIAISAVRIESSQKSAKGVVASEN